MTVRTLRAPRRWKVLVVGVALALATSIGSRTPLMAADDPKADPLPKGAKLRLGSVAAPRYSIGSTLLPPDYKTSLSADYNGRVRRFDAITGRSLDKSDGPFLATGLAIVVSGDGKRFATMRNTSVFVRDTTKGDVILEIKPPAPGAGYIASTMLSLSADGKVLAQSRQTREQTKDRKSEVAIWDVDENKELVRIEPFHQGPSLPVLSPDGTILATHAAQPYYGGAASERPNPDPNRTVQVWNVESGKELFKAPLTGALSQAATVAFSPNGRTMAVSCGDGPIDLWDVPTGKAKTTLLGRTRQGLRLAFSPDGKTLAAIAIDGAIQRWAVADGKALGTTEGPAELPLSVAQGLAFASNDRVVAWGHLGQFPIIWEAPSGKLLTPVPQHYQPIKSIGFAAGGKELVTTATDGRIVRWNAATGKPLGEMTLRTNRLSGSYRAPLTLSPDGTRAIAVTGNTAAVYDLGTGGELLAVPTNRLSGTGPYQTYSIPTADLTKVVSMSVSYDGKKTGSCVVWDVVAQKKLGEIELVSSNTGVTPAVAVSPSGERLVTAMYVNNPNPGGGIARALVITGWDLKTGKKLGVIEHTNANYSQVSIAAASEMSVIVSAGGGKVRLYDYESGKGGDEIEAAAPRGGADASSPIVFSPDRKRFAIGVTGEDASSYGVRVYDWPSARPLHTFTGLRTPTSALAFSPDGKTLASGSQDTSVLLWDLSVVKEE